MIADLYFSDERGVHEGRGTKDTKAKGHFCAYPKKGGGTPNTRSVSRRRRAGGGRVEEGPRPPSRQTPLSRSSRVAFWPGGRLQVRGGCGAKNWTLQASRRVAPRTVYAHRASCAHMRARVRTCVHMSSAPVPAHVHAMKIYSCRLYA